jgi:hypothetical protein
MIYAFPLIEGWLVNSIKLLISVLLVLSDISGAQESCPLALSPSGTKEVFLPVSLTSFWQNETRGLSVGDIKSLNRKTLTTIQNEIPQSTSNRSMEIKLSDLNKVIDATRSNEVVGFLGKDRYQAEDRNIGYCFGRATFIHLLLLKMGLNKNSIRKIWAVGPMKTSRYSEDTWAFHVATVVYTEDWGWMTLDTNESKAQPIRHWISTYQDLSTDGKVRFYITSPEKFGLDDGVYSRIQLGLDLPREHDWYKGYFQDLMKSLQQLDLAKLGLQKLPKTSLWLKTPQTRTKAPSAKEGVLGFLLGAETD